MLAAANYTLIRYRELEPFRPYTINEFSNVYIHEGRLRSTSGIDRILWQPRLRGPKGGPVDNKCQVTYNIY